MTLNPIYIPDPKMQKIIRKAEDDVRDFFEPIYKVLRAADAPTEPESYGLSVLSAAPEPDVGMRSGTARWVK